MTPGRHAVSSPELDEAERAWWEANADLEDRFCWAQTAGMQVLLRGGYLRRVCAGGEPGQVVVELGCGSGWLTRLMAARTRSRVVGIDFSPRQVELARREEGRAEFRLGSIEQVAVDLAPATVVIHAVLHHLAQAEIEQWLGSAAAAVGPGGRVVVFEPVAAGGTRVANGTCFRLLRRLEGLPLRLSARGWRRIGPAEADVRARLSARPKMDAPFGPAPKETPFREGELDHLLHRCGLRILSRRGYLVMAHLVAQEMLIAELSQPKLWGVLKWPLVATARALDAAMLRRGTSPPGAWEFTLYDCRVDPAEDRPVA